ncbi:hypothetical protein Glove_266g19 [Diversispora epigaea]|uniref:Uncharacterized protein n=1 Tax=Diversispora epigaea TaxID=1348612 RepID=A0A397I7F4_9GLOM|nr:hypothetical protein Glove_266g19 [Diversispora epigaea]
MIQVIKLDKTYCSNIDNSFKVKLIQASEEILPDKIFIKEISSRVTHRPTFEELNNELSEYYFDYDDYLKEGKNKDSEIVIQIKKAEDFFSK